MTGYLPVNFSMDRGRKTFVFLILCYAIVSIIVMHGYIQPLSLSFLLGALAIPFTLERDRYPVFSYRYALVATLWLLTCWFIPVKTLLFFSAGFAILFLIETWYGKAGFLSVVTLLFVAPIFQYAANVFSFPIRLQLTEWAGKLLDLMLYDISTKGNVIYYHGNEFSVDPACMGLNMLVASLLLGVIFMGFYQRKLGKNISWLWVLVYLTVVLILNVINNIARILILVIFHLMPGNWLHDAAGLLCMILYVLLPASFLAKFFVMRLGGKKQPQPNANETKRLQTAMHFVLLAAISVSCFRVAKVDTFSNFQLKSKTIGAYNAALFAPGIVKLENNHALIYVKYVRGFYDSDHSPMLCWKGSGYELQQIKKETIAGNEMFTALLINGNEKLYTAWWYGNHEKATTSQWNWRWDMLKSAKKYAIVNVTTESENELKAEVGKVLKDSGFSALFEN